VTVTQSIILAELPIVETTEGDYWTVSYDALGCVTAVIFGGQSWNESGIECIPLLSLIYDTTMLHQPGYGSLMSEFWEW
jgi:hypothetical protein